MSIAHQQVQTCKEWPAEEYKMGLPGRGGPPVKVCACPLRPPTMSITHQHTEELQEYPMLSKMKKKRVGMLHEPGDVLCCQCDQCNELLPPYNLVAIQNLHIEGRALQKKRAET